MFDKTILSLGLAVALATGLVASPAKATPAGALIAAGAVGAIFAAGITASHADEGRVAIGGAWDYGAPGWRRPVAVGVGPGRHTVCAWQDRYDRHERYVGSRQVCWVEAY